VNVNSKQGAEAQTPPQWGWVETEVWTERMLAALGNGVKGGKWFGLVDKVYALRTLHRAWQRVRSNKGANHHRNGHRPDKELMPKPKIVTVHPALVSSKVSLRMREYML